MHVERKHSAETPRPKDLAPIPIGPAAPIRGFKHFNATAVKISTKVKKTSQEVNDQRKYWEWLHAFTARNDGLTLVTKARKVMAYSKIEDVFISVDTGLATVRNSKGWAKRKILKPQACLLQRADKDHPKDDEWGDCARTKELYLDRTMRSNEMRKTVSRGSLRLIYSRPDYPEPFARGDGGPSRPLPAWKLIRAAMTTRRDVGLTVLRQEAKVHTFDTSVEAANLMGPPRPLEMEYSGDDNLEDVIAKLEEHVSDSALEKRLALMEKVGHCNLPILVPAGYVRQRQIVDYMLVKTAGYPTERVYPKLELLPPETAPDEERWIAYWSQQHEARSDCNLLELIKSRPTMKILHSSTWETMKSLSRRKKFRAQRLHRKEIEPSSMKNDRNIADTRLRLYENQARHGLISIEELNLSKSKLQVLSNLLEECKLLPVAVGKPYGGYSREATAELIRQENRATYSGSLPYNELEQNLDYQDPTTIEVITDHSVCRVLGDAIEGEYIPVVVKKSYTPPISLDAYIQTASGIYIPKSALDYRNHLEHSPDLELESETGVKPCDDEVPAERTWWDAFLDVALAGLRPPQY